MSFKYKPTELTQSLGRKELVNPYNVYLQSCFFKSLVKSGRDPVKCPWKHQGMSDTASSISSINHTVRRLLWNSTPKDLRGLARPSEALKETNREGDRHKRQTKGRATACVSVWTSCVLPETSTPKGMAYTCCAPLPFRLLCVVLLFRW